jgi:hypothetical protein
MGSRCAGCDVDGAIKLYRTLPSRADIVRLLTRKYDKPHQSFSAKVDSILRY